MSDSLLSKICPSKDGFPLFFKQYFRKESLLKALPKKYILRGLYNPSFDMYDTGSSIFSCKSTGVDGEFFSKRLFDNKFVKFSYLVKVNMDKLRTQMIESRTEKDATLLLFWEVAKRRCMENYSEQIYKRTHVTNTHDTERAQLSTNVDTSYDKGHDQKLKFLSCLQQVEIFNSSSGLLEEYLNEMSITKSNDVTYHTKSQKYDQQIFLMTFTLKDLTIDYQALKYIDEINPFVDVHDLAAALSTPKVQTRSHSSSPASISPYSGTQVNALSSPNNGKQYPIGSPVLRNSSGRATPSNLNVTQKQQVSPQPTRHNGGHTATSKQHLNDKVHENISKQDISGHLRKTSLAYVLKCLTMMAIQNVRAFHSVGIMHCDIYTGNILCFSNPTIFRTAFSRIFRDAHVGDAKDKDEIFIKRELSQKRNSSKFLLPFGHHMYYHSKNVGRHPVTDHSTNSKVGTTLSPNLDINSIITSKELLIDIDHKIIPQFSIIDIGNLIEKTHNVSEFYTDLNFGIGVSTNKMNLIRDYKKKVSKINPFVDYNSTDINSKDVYGIPLPRCSSYNFKRMGDIVQYLSSHSRIDLTEAITNVNNSSCKCGSQQCRFCYLYCLLDFITKYYGFSSSVSSNGCTDGKPIDYYLRVLLASSELMYTYLTEPITAYTSRSPEQTIATCYPVINTPTKSNKNDQNQGSSSYIGLKAHKRQLLSNMTDVYSTVMCLVGMILGYTFKSRARDMSLVRDYRTIQEVMSNVNTKDVANSGGTRKTDLRTSTTRTPFKEPHKNSRNLAGIKMSCFRVSLNKAEIDSDYESRTPMTFYYKMDSGYLPTNLKCITITYTKTTKKLLSLEDGSSLYDQRYSAKHAIHFFNDSFLSKCVDISKKYCNITDDNWLFSPYEVYSCRRIFKLISSVKSLEKEEGVNIIRKCIKNTLLTIDAIGLPEKYHLMLQKHIQSLRKIYNNEIQNFTVGHAHTKGGTEESEKLPHKIVETSFSRLTRYMDSKLDYKKASTLMKDEGKSLKEIVSISRNIEPIMMFIEMTMEEIAEDYCCTGYFQLFIAMEEKLKKRGWMKSTLMDTLEKDYGFYRYESEDFSELACASLSWEPENRPSTLEWINALTFDNLVSSSEKSLEDLNNVENNIYSTDFVTNNLTKLSIISGCGLERILTSSPFRSTMNFSNFYYEQTLGSLVGFGFYRYDTPLKKRHLRRLPQMTELQNALFYVYSIMSGKKCCANLDPIVNIIDSKFDGKYMMIQDENDETRKWILFCKVDNETIKKNDRENVEDLVDLYSTLMKDYLYKQIVKDIRGEANIEVSISDIFNDVLDYMSI